MYFQLSLWEFRTLGTGKILKTDLKPCPNFGIPFLLHATMAFLWVHADAFILGIPMYYSAHFTSQFAPFKFLEKQDSTEAGSRMQAKEKINMDPSLSG